MDGWQHHTATIRKLHLHYVEAGAGPLVVLLHGFPGFWFCWRHQIPALAAAGLRVIAPDLRGFNLSDKPRGARQYDLDTVADDIASLVHHAGETRASVVGHDWGGGVAWTLAMRHPSLVERLAVLNAPHPLSFARALLTPAQLRRSWYMFFFQLPLVPELAIRAHDYAALRRVLRSVPQRSGAFSPEDIASYVAALAMPGALTAGLNYYRAAFRSPRRGLRRLRRIEAPVQVIWGAKDHALGIELARPPERWVANARVDILDDASHWVQSDRPDAVNALLLDFLGAGLEAPSATARTEPPPAPSPH